MARTTDEILVGTGTMYVAALSTAFPTNPDTTPSGSWAEVGYSEGGWNFEVDKTFEDVPVAEEVDPVATFKTAQAIRVTGELSQASLTNIQLAMGGGTISPSTPGAGYTTYTPPASSEFTEKALLLRVNAPKVGGTYQLRDIQCPRAVAAGAFQMAHAKAPQKTVIAIEFRLLVPSSGDIFTIIDAVT